ncbi:MAG: ABC transporter [Acidimicrobiales bacterium]|nr:MAG: ABC transporter [Acidimicrobiales bacterium]
MVLLRPGGRPTRTDGGRPVTGPHDGSRLEVSGLCVRRGGFRAGPLSLELGPGDCVALVGPNGSGKSTLLLGILGLLPAVAGSVRINGSEVTHRRPPQGVGVVLAWPGFYPWVSGADNLRLAAEGDPGALARVEAVLEDVGLAGAADRRVCDYSTGMVKRLEMARALLFEPRVLVLDEPTNGLDDEAWHWLSDRLSAHLEQGFMILLATHDTEFLEVVKSQRVHLEAGSVSRVVEDRR